MRSLTCTTGSTTTSIGCAAGNSTPSGTTRTQRAGARPPPRRAALCPAPRRQNLSIQVDKPRLIIVVEMAVDASRVASDLHVAIGRLVRRLRQGHVPGDLTLSEASVLSRLDIRGPATPSELANEERVRPQAMSVTLAGLESRGLVARSGDPGDGRRVLMSVTDAGRQLLVDRRGVKAARLARAMASGFTAEEQQRLADATPLLERLASML
jgi:DNA-binding MarR family transcriptional regulator